MFNWSLKLREQSGLSIPHGPSFKKARKISFAINGTEISLRAPRHSPNISSNEAIQPRKEYEIDVIRMNPFKSYNYSWLYKTLLQRSWGFYGEWFTGFKGELSMCVALVTREETPQTVSLFRPKVFENTLADFLRYRYADDIYKGTQEWLAPVDWKVVNAWPSPAATYYVRPNIYNAGSTDRCFLFPITDKHFIEFQFNLHRECAGFQSEKDQLISISPLEKLSTDIMNSIQVKLSPEALAQQAKALEGLEDTGLSESFPPIKFTTPEQDAEHERYLQEEKRIQDILKGK